MSSSPFIRLCLYSSSVSLLCFRYGAYLSKERVPELIAPHKDKDTLEFIHSWLEHYGVPPSSISTSPAGGWLTIAGVPVSQVDQLFCASYQQQQHTGTNETKAILRSVDYGPPAVLHAHMESVEPTTFSEEASVMVNATSGELMRGLSRRDDDVVVTFPPRWPYQTEAYVPAAMGQNALGILGFENEYPSQENLTHSMISYWEDTEDATFTVMQVNGSGYDPGLETNLDIQYAVALAPQTFYSTAAGAVHRPPVDGLPASSDPCLEWLGYVLVLLVRTARCAAWGQCSYWERRRRRQPWRRLARQLRKCYVPCSILYVVICLSRKRRKSLTRPPLFFFKVLGSLVTPEVARILSEGVFSRYFELEDYQEAAASTILEHLGNDYAGIYKCVHLCTHWGRGILSLRRRHTTGKEMNCREQLGRQTKFTSTL